MDITDQIKQSARSMGFEVAVSPALVLDQDGQRYQAWCADGFAADLQYMQRAYPRRWVAQDLLPSARSVISLTVNYYGPPRRLERKMGFGRLARYAWGLDYHEVILQRLKNWCLELKSQFGTQFESRIVIDSAPLLERAFAMQGGLGFIGKNTLLISRKIGSFVFLAEVLTNLNLTPDAPLAQVKDKDACGSCRQCLVDCPTGALVSPRRLDARKCISYWTIENRGAIDVSLREAIGDWIFGCDVCQEVCPYQGVSPLQHWPEFSAQAGAGPYLSLLEVLSLDEKAFKSRFKHTPLLRAKRAGLLRNACVVAGNQKFAPALSLLNNLAQDAQNPLLQEHALWAIKKIES